MIHYTLEFHMRALCMNYQLPHSESIPQLVDCDCSTRSDAKMFPR
jgi:hypothetical protein